MEKEILVAASGYFDPLHIGHIEYLKKAKELGRKLVVIVNTDQQAILKKGYVFMPLDERVKILKSLNFVDEVFVSIDDDETVCKSIEAVKPDIFAKGGDKNKENIPESAVCERIKCKIVNGLGEKICSSSELVKRMINLKQDGL